MKRLKVTVEGKVYQVMVEPVADDAPDFVSAPAATAPSPASQAPAASSGGTPVPSPLAGKVVTIDVSVGQAVSEGSQLMVLEAMKMNTYIYAPADGSIGNILVSEGDTVEEGHDLILMA